MSASAERDPERSGDEPIRGHVRSRGFRRVSHGLFLKIVADLDQADEFLRDLEAWTEVLPDSAVFTHVTAARLLGWELPKLPEQVPVFAAVDRDDPRPRREGLICSRLTRKRSGFVAGGFPIDSPEEILLRAARDLGVLDLVIMIDSARSRGDLDGARMKALLESGRPGVKVLAAAFGLSNAKRESGGETVLGCFHAAMEVASEPQVSLHDAEGRFIGRVDFLITGTDWVHEYDGEMHRAKSQHRTDLRRERGWSGTSYRRKGFTLDDLLNHPLVVMHEIDRDLGRPHRNRRLERWRTLVRESLYDVPGRDRVLNRWRRAMGVVQWS
ncbi:hypothetical protein [Nocardioides sp. W7]|uniref:hypothetical protein n=1 Tax=Nocardioides sp. W7 TaxID=2931390 RepID=UPI001FD1528B|nr:hypothetical protein [Nocardioides sp. W7]